MKNGIICGVILCLSGCASLQQAVDAYGGAAIDSARRANDSYLKAWMSAACGTTVGAALRNPQSIQALKVLCMPAADIAPASLLDPAARPGRE